MLDHRNRYRPNKMHTERNISTCVINPRGISVNLNCISSHWIRTTLPGYNLCKGNSWESTPVCRKFRNAPIFMSKHKTFVLNWKWSIARCPSPCAALDFHLLHSVREQIAHFYFDVVKTFSSTWNRNTRPFRHVDTVSMYFIFLKFQYAIIWYVISFLLFLLFLHSIHMRAPNSIMAENMQCVHVYRGTEW